MQLFFAGLTPIQPVNTLEYFAVWHSSANEMQFKNSASQGLLLQLREATVGIETYLFGQIKHYFSPHDGFGHRESLPHTPFVCFFRDVTGVALGVSMSKDYGLCLFFHEASTPAWRKEKLTKLIEACNQLRQQLKDDPRNFDVPLDHSLNWLANVNVTTMVHVLPLKQIDARFEPLHQTSENIVGERPRFETNISADNNAALGRILVISVVALCLIKPAAGLIAGILGDSTLLATQLSTIALLYFLWRGMPWARYILATFWAYDIFKMIIGWMAFSTSSTVLIGLPYIFILCILPTYFIWVTLISKHAAIFLNIQYNNHN